jgi:superfamily II DNA or RNA helicase
VSIESIGSFSVLLNSLSPDPLTRGKQFERLAKWWLTQDPIRSLDVKNVWLWDEWPEYPGRDIGIDLVAELFDGSLCAIQAKCFDENRDIPKSELDSFISAASQHTFQHRWLIATTDRLSANARRMLDDQHVVRILRSDLEASLDSWPTSIDDLNPIPQPKSTPRPHQDSAIKDVVKGLQEHDRGQLIMACGTGKTLTALWIKETLQPKTTLVLVPSLNLLAQTLAEWAKNTSSPWNYLCVCSDDTVNRADDQPISTVGDLPFDVTTNSEQIASFLQLGGEKIIFSTYQSSAQVARAQEGSETMFDLVICDEAHRLTGKTDADYATVLDEKKIVAEKRLFMTATPRTYTTAVKTKAEERGVEITSMDDEHIYGPVLHKLSFGEAIKQELLSDYRVLIVGVTDPQVQDLIDRRELVSINDAVTTDARTLAAHIGLAKATKDYNLKRTISFHSRIKTADQFARDHAKILEWLPESHKPSGETWTGTISGAMNTGDRRKLLTQLRLDGEDRHAILTNARCLTEGVDVPSLDGVAFIDPRSSQVDIIQAVGRAIRKSENKDLGTIVLPVLIPTDADAEHALADSAFKPIWAILNALKSHDDEFTFELNNLRTELGRTNNPGNFPKRLVIDLPINIDFLVPSFYSKFSVEILERTTESWEWWFGQMQTYAEENGDCNIPIRNHSGPNKLGLWVSNQRAMYQRGNLDQQKIDRLESLTNWIWDWIENQWQENFQAFLVHVAENSTTQILASVSNGQLLRSWTAKQRSQYKKGKLDSIKIALLESISGWMWDPSEEQWKQNFDLLLQYTHQTGSARPPQSFVFEGRNLGSWASAQRSKFNKDTLAKEKITKLQALPGWTWDPYEEAWEQAFEALIRYSEINGTAQPPRSHIVNGLQLGPWVHAQRQQFNKQELDQAKVDRLEAVPGWTWDPHTEAWEQAFTALTRYTEINGTARPPQNYEADNFRLGSWVGTQRQNYRKQKLETERVIRLEALPGWTWDPHTEAWEQAFTALTRYTEINGTARPPQGLVFEDLQLGSWVITQRYKFRTDVLPQDQGERLESLSGWSWHTIDDSWKEYFNALLAYCKRTGDSNPLQAHIEGDLKLGTWVNSQRQRFAKGSLESERAEQLMALPNWSWNPTDDSWAQNFQLLSEYADEFGNSRVPQGFLYKQVRLGTWVSKQRGSYRAGKLDKKKEKLLEGMPGWVWNPFDEDWESNYSLLLEFLSSEGHINVNSNVHKKWKTLERWVDNQRANYSRDRLNPDQVKRLEDLPEWKWNLRQHSWDQYFALLQKFVEEHGHARVLQNHLHDGVRLGTWVNKQRGFYKRGSLPADRCELLENLPEWTWYPGLTRKEEGFELLQGFVNREGHARVPSKHVEQGFALGQWVTSRQQTFKRGKMLPTEQHRLENIPGWSWTRQE